MIAKATPIFGIVLMAAHQVAAVRLEGASESRRFDTQPATTFVNQYRYVRVLLFPGCAIRIDRSGTWKLYGPPHQTGSLRVGLRLLDFSPFDFQNHGAGGPVYGNCAWVLAGSRNGGHSQLERPLWLR
jgi:hypothetical protein